VDGVHQHRAAMAADSGGVLSALKAVILFLRGLMMVRGELATENRALCQQLGVLQNL